MKLMYLITAAFCGAKLAGWIDWSWWAVTAPLWGAFGAVFAFALFGTIWVKVWRRRQRKKRRVV